MLTADFLNGVSVPFVLTNDATLGRGATAEVRAALVGDRRFAIKLYKQEHELNEAKILGMCAFGDPSRSDQFEYAWPVGVVKSNSALAGYLMETFDNSKHYPLNYFFDPTFYSRLNSIDIMSLSNRVEIALSLCRAIRALHSNGIYFIDLKPQNILVNWHRNICVLLDCDGFSFRGPDGTRFPAGHISTDYIAPEATREKLTAADLGVPQDNYALAVILFQLFNYAQHPFQGISSGVGLQSATNDEYAAAGLYPYGIVPNSLIAPRRGSTHECMPHDLRLLFDRAFVGNPNQRVSPQEWVTYFENLIEKKLLKKCDKRSSALSHVSFHGGQCAECARLAFVLEQPKPKIVAPAVPQPVSPLPPQVPPKDNTLRNIFLYGIVAVLVGYLLVGNDERQATLDLSETTATPSNSTQKPAAADNSVPKPATNKSKPKYELHTVWMSPISGEWVLDDTGYKNTWRVWARNETGFVLRNPKFHFKLQDCDRYSKRIIMEVQNKLKALGIPVGFPDGIMGNRTKDGIRIYQKRSGIPVTGKIDYPVLSSLNIDDSQEFDQVLFAVPQTSPIPAKSSLFIDIPYLFAYTDNRQFCYKISAQHEKKVP
jgi:serine/threonine protein kinase